MAEPCFSINCQPTLSSASQTVNGDSETLFYQGGKQYSQPTNIRLICATNRNLDEMVHNGEFREDLLYRINTIHLHIPALQGTERRYPSSGTTFLEQYNQQYLRTLTGFSADAETASAELSLVWKYP